MVSDHDLEKRLENRLGDVYSFSNAVNNMKKMITYFMEKINNSK